MRHLLTRAALAVTAAIIVSPAQAQSYPAPVAPPPPPSASTSVFPGPTPEDAYRQGLINRWEFEQIAGRLPPALQGPSVDGSKGGSNGGRGE